MILYTACVQLPKCEIIVRDNKLRQYSNHIYTFDIETSSVFDFNGKIYTQNEILDMQRKDPDFDISVYERKGYMYMWQFGIDDTVYYGRTWDTFYTFIQRLDKEHPYRKIVYVHNLAFEFQFVRNIHKFLDPFCRKQRKPIKSKTEFNIEYRCSYFLTVMSLEKAGKAFKSPVQKAIGDLDYNAIRNSLTPLTNEELHYAENDILVLYHVIKHYRDKYRYVYNIPLTQTGEVRRQCYKLFKNDISYIRHMQKLVPQNATVYKFMRECFVGGYNHANYIHVGTVLTNVKSRDLSSAYPTHMVLQDYPCELFSKRRIKNLQQLDNFVDDKIRYMVKVRFTHIKSNFFNNFISRSKCYDCERVVPDNGRVVEAEKLTIYLIDVDLEIVRKAYKFDKCEIIDFYYAKAAPLDKRLIEEILKYYQNKTSYKDLLEFFDLYTQGKQFINSIYGMFVTNVIANIIIYENIRGWDVDKLTDELIEKLLEKQRKSYRTFLSYGQGIYVPAFPRKDLWDIIMQIDRDIVYNDTDSVKYIGEHEDVFEEFNRKRVDALNKRLIELGLDPELTRPKKPNGQAAQLGVFEFEGEYDKFKTLGCKRYIYEKDGELHMTASGINKEKGVLALKSIDDFKDGVIFPAEISGKSIVDYNDNQSHTILTDKYGNSVKYTDKYGICIYAQDYHLTVAEIYHEHEQERGYELDD